MDDLKIIKEGNEFNLSNERRFDTFAREYIYPELKVKEAVRLLFEAIPYKETNWAKLMRLEIKKIFGRKLI